MKEVDYLIVGQGLAGSALAWELMNRGRTIVVFDEPSANRASRMAAGICNPITGRGMVTTYMADILFPFLAHFYSHAERELRKKFFFPLPIYRPFISGEEMLRWKEKVVKGALPDFVMKVHCTPYLDTMVHDPFGGLEITQSGYLHVKDWISAIREWLISKDAYREERFNENKLIAGETIVYGEFIARKIIFCNGLAALQSKWFSWLPLKPLKGETLEVAIPVGPNHIISRGAYLVPSSKEGNFNVGATYQHGPFSEGPSAEACQQLESKLQSLIKIPYTILHQNWGIRPTVSDRRPLLGQHPTNKNVVIFNGLGTKGVSLSPYFAKCLADWMDTLYDMPPEVNIYRFKSLYSE